MWKKGIFLSQISQAKSVNKTPSKPQVKIRRYLTEKCRMNSQGHILHMGNDCCNKELLLPTPVTEDSLILHLVKILQIQVQPVKNEIDSLFLAIQRI